MKVFIPMSDATLSDRGEVNQGLVPFNPEFLEARLAPESGHKPSNWISESSREMARERLYATQA